MKKKAKIALTMGCPEGVGPELAVSAAAKLAAECDIIIYGDKDILKKAANIRHPREDICHPREDICHPREDICHPREDICHPRESGDPEHLNALDSGFRRNDRVCAIDSINNLNIRDIGSDSFKILEAATEDVLSGKMDALVTCPINKRRWNEAGVQFTGHTEYLAKRTGAASYAMMMASPRLKVTLATIHEPVKDIASNLTKKKIVTSATLTHEALKKYFAVSNPRIAVAALNPHCGDGGLLGNEEMVIIAPAIEELRRKNVNASGPFSADAIFGRAVSGEYDAVIAMYHDQGLAPIKTLDYKGTVNITLGLPIIRTSVDHGTAEDIAWRGIAEDANLIAAIRMAIRMKTLPLP